MRVFRELIREILELVGGITFLLLLLVFVVLAASLAQVSIEFNNPLVSFLVLLTILALAYIILQFLTWFNRILRRL
ncbi:MAG: hypothetical protein ABDH61_00660 [Acidilobaceae archaeon]